MSLTLSDAAANAALDGGLRQQFATGDLLEIRSGARPASANTAPTGTVLATIVLPATPFAAAAARAIAKSGTWQDLSADATGTATWFRLKKAADNNTTDATQVRVDGDCGIGTGDLQLDNTNIAFTQQVTISGFTLSL